MSTDTDFESKTHSELSRVNAELTALRAEIARNRPDHVLSFSCVCSYCARAHRLHAQIDDHLDQLSVVVDTVDAPDDLRPHTLHQSPTCGTCGRMRYENGQGAIACLGCDGYPSGLWTGLSAP